MSQPVQGEIAMPVTDSSLEKNEALLAFVKEVSGRRIERARRRAHITQENLARRLHMGARWLREIEGGNPTSRLDDHLLCAHELGLSNGHILLPLLFFGHDMAFPRQLAHGDLVALERQCIDLIAERNIRELTDQLTPKWWPASSSQAA
jgi:transcriptional regulator with XRE-family HTH domain